MIFTDTIIRETMKEGRKMTNEQAITNLKIALNEVVECIDNADVARVPNEAYVMKPALEMAIEALEKHVAKKPLADNVGGYSVFICPFCECNYVDNKQFCDCCGQKLDWN